MIDLHVHTSHSDGSCSVKDILTMAEDKNMDLISITDHDNIDAYFEMDEDENIKRCFSGNILTGSELKAVYEGVSIEVLGYGFNHHDLRIHKVDTRKLQCEYLRLLKNTIKDLGFKCNYDELYIDANNPMHYYAGPVVARELLKYQENKKIIEEIGEFVDNSFFRVHLSNVDSPFYIDESPYFLGLDEVVERIHKAGGLAFLAHGYVYAFKDKYKTIEEILKSTKIDGLESIYPLFSDAEVKHALSITDKYKKFCSCGSDYHGLNKPDIQLGENKGRVYSRALVNDWVEKCDFYK